MKKISIFICVIALILSLCGCGNNATQETENTNSNINENVNNPTYNEIDISNEDEIIDETESSVESDDGSLIPDGVKDGTVLSNGSIYFDDVLVNSAEDIKNILDNYGDGKTDIVFTTPEYTGIVQRTDDSYIISKTSDKFTEDVIYMDIGIINTNRCEYDNGVLVFQHTDSTEADYYVDIYYENYIQKHEIIGDDGTVREVKEYEATSDYYVLTYVKYNGGEQWFEYADKVNKILSSMRVSESNGMDYTFVFDSGGNTEANVVSMTLTKEGSTTNYSKNEIPWQIGFVAPPGRLTRN